MSKVTKPAEAPKKETKVVPQTKDVASMTWEERTVHLNHLNTVYGKEADLRSQGKEFDTAEYEAKEV